MYPEVMPAALPFPGEQLPALIPFCPAGLYEELCRREVLAAAACFVQENPSELALRGAPPDGWVVNLDRLVDDLQRELHARTYRPGPVYRVCRVRRRARNECVRVLLPRDRMVAVALLLTLQPILVAGDFDAGPTARGLTDIQSALRCGCYRVVPTGGREVLSRDSLGLLLRRVISTVQDEAVRDLIKRLLRAPLVEELRLAG